MVAVIGDIHGCYNTLKALVEQIRKKYPGIMIYSVGDLIDRGNFSYEVIEYMIKENIPFTPGNHDFMFYFFINFPSSPMGNSWLFNGYENTIQSYEGKEKKIKEHLEIIEKAPLFFNLEDCFISHAGISKNYKSKLPDNFLSNEESLSKFLADDLTESYSIIWTRGELLNIGKLQVVGHTRMNEAIYNQSSNALYIDTSIYSGNKLTSAISENNKLIEMLSEKTFPEDIK